MNSFVYKYRYQGDNKLFMYVHEKNTSYFVYRFLKSHFNFITCSRFLFRYLSKFHDIDKYFKITYSIKYFSTNLKTDYLKIKLIKFYKNFNISIYD